MEAEDELKKSNYYEVVLDGNMKVILCETPLWHSVVLASHKKIQQ